jgi:hypothetical protein
MRTSTPTPAIDFTHLLDGKLAPLFAKFNQFNSWFALVDETHASFTHMEQQLQMSTTNWVITGKIYHPHHNYFFEHLNNYSSGQEEYFEEEVAEKRKGPPKTLSKSSQDLPSSPPLELRKKPPKGLHQSQHSYHHYLHWDRQTNFPKVFTKQMWGGCMNLC